MITEDYVSFETAKLLKEKGFDDEYTNAFYDKTGNLYFIDLLSDLSQHMDNDIDIAASTLYVAMKRLRDVHKIHIEITALKPYGSDENHHEKPLEGVRYHPNIVWIDKWNSLLAEFKNVGITTRDSYEEACEAAIKYCLENLI